MIMEALPFSTSRSLSQIPDPGLRPSRTSLSRPPLLLAFRPMRTPRSRGVMSAIAAWEEQDMKKGSNVDFRDPDWKPKFHREFERRFDLPHIRDVFPDASPIPSTFCLKMRSPTEDFAGGYPSDEKWHGYINNDDRVLLKVPQGSWRSKISVPERAHGGDNFLRSMGTPQTGQVVSSKFSLYICFS